MRFASSPDPTFAWCSVRRREPRLQPRLSSRTIDSAAGFQRIDDLLLRCAWLGHSKAAESRPNLGHETDLHAYLGEQPPLDDLS